MTRSATPTSRQLDLRTGSLHQRRMHLPHLASRAIKAGLIEEFIRTAPSGSRPAGYAVRLDTGSPGQRWVTGSLGEITGYLTRLIDEAGEPG